MTLSSISFAIISCVALIGAGLLWSRKMLTSTTGHQHSKETAVSLISFSRARPSMELGMEHARRLGYKLAIIVIQGSDSAGSRIAAANDESNAREESGGMETRLVDVLRNTSLLRETLRMTDIVAYDEDRQFVVIMLPGIDNEHTAHATYTAQRIRMQLRLEPCNGVQIGCAEFPGDGLLLDDLISSALSRLGESEAVGRIHPGTRLNATK